jgi:opacity protein-like surface antigen
VTAAACVALSAAWASPARAVDVEVSSDTAVQAYEVANPWADYALARRRITELLGMSLYHLQGKYAPDKDDYTMRLKFRLDSDPGINSHLPDDQAGAETDFSVGNGSRYVPGLSPANFDLMYAYVEGRNLAKGWLGFKVGRQYVTDVLGWWSFDGGLVRVTTPYFFELEAYGGMEQRGGLPLSTTRFEQQGIWRGSHGDFGTDPGDPANADYPSYDFASPAPAFGFALESNGPNWVHGRLTYRRVYSTGEAFTRQFPDANGGYPTVSGLRVSSDRIGYALNANLAKIGGVKGGFSYDLYNQVFPYAFAGIEAYLGNRVTVGGDFDYYRPTFDADSIFNWFAIEPQMTGTGRVEARLTKQLDLSASGGAKVFFTEGDRDSFYKGECAAAQPPPDATPLVPIPCDEALGNYDAANTNGVADDLRDPKNNETNAEIDGVGQLSARYRVSRAHFELRSMAEAGARGRRVGGDLSGEGNIQGGRWAFGGRLSLYNFSDPMRMSPDGKPRETTSFGYVLGVGWKPLDLSKINIEWEHDYNALVGNRFRILGTLAVLWIK